MNAQVLVPGILVALRRTISGGVHYDRRDLASDERTKTWETTRIIDDPEELDRAQRVRNAAAGLVRGVCVFTSFGLLCPADREAELDLRIDQARQMVRLFNEDAKYTRVGLYALKGRIAESDAEAVRAVVEEARGLLDEMNEGLDGADVEKVRSAANRARDLQAMFTGDAAGQVAQAVEAARKAAREIVRRTNKKGEDVATVLAEVDRRSFDAARFAFLEVQEQLEADALPSIDLQRAAELEVN